MKELSIEEKAKRYDEAIRESSKIINHCAGGANIPECVSVKATIEQIFPELKESEDEKIRKELLTFFRESIHGGHILTNKEYDSWIAWLEKQGEKEKFIKKELECIKGYREKAIKRLEELEKQGSQNLANSAKTCKDEQKPYGQRQECTDCQFNYAGECKGSCAMKRGEQKPAWSEEDRIKCNGAIHLLENLIKEGYFDRDSDDVQVAFDLKFACKGLINWLKSLKDRVQPQQKQEWSEEDESYLNTTIAYLKDAKEFKKTAENCIIWLKSLRPQNRWKPSDEQIKALTHLFEGHLVGAKLIPKDYDNLKLLLEQLKN